MISLMQVEINNPLVNFSPTTFLLFDTFSFCLLILNCTGNQFRIRYTKLPGIREIDEFSKCKIFNEKKKKNSRKRCSIYHWKLTVNNAEIFRSIGRRPNKQTNKQTNKNSSNHLWPRPYCVGKIGKLTFISLIRHSLHSNSSRK